MDLIRSLAVLVATAGLLAGGCGGGGGGSSNPPPVGGGGGSGGGSGGGGSGGGGSSGAVLVGQFKDSNVEGLDYRTPSRSGTTNALGQYEYLAGEQVTFAVGGVELGSGPARRMFTPIDLGSGGGTSSTRSQNVVRFLMMLDRDGDPSNGILISQAVRDMARNWQQVDFGTSDLGNALVTIISDVASVDDRTPALPDAATARAHLEDTLYCTLSGVFQGTLSGSRTGPVTVVLRPTGQAHAIGVGDGALLGPGRPVVGRGSVRSSPARNPSAARGASAATRASSRPPGGSGARMRRGGSPASGTTTRGLPTSNARTPWTSIRPATSPLGPWTARRAARTAGRAGSPGTCSRSTGTRARRARGRWIRRHFGSKAPGAAASLAAGRPTAAD